MGGTHSRKAQVSEGIITPLRGAPQFPLEPIPVYLTLPHIPTLPNCVPVIAASLWAPLPSGAVVTSGAPKWPTFSAPLTFKVHPALQRARGRMDLRKAKSANPDYGRVGLSLFGREINKPTFTTLCRNERSGANPAAPAAGMKGKCGKELFRRPDNKEVLS